MRALMRIVAGIALTVVLATAASAQSIGVKGGWARPTMGGSDAQDVKAMNTFAGGAFGALKVAPAFALQLEALYAVKGAGGEDVGSGVTAKVKIGYIEVPLLAKALFPIENSKVKPTLFAGPFVGFKTSCNIKGSGAGISISMKCADAETPMKSTDFGVTFGGGLGFPLAQRLSGLLEARYDLGLTKIDDSTPQSNVKTRAFMIMAGFSIPVGREAKEVTMR